MEHRKRIGLLAAGLGLLLMMAAGIVTVSAMPPSQEGEPPNLDADYVGSGVCVMCHTQDDTWHASGHAQMVRPPSNVTILGDLTDSAAVTIPWPDGTERPITAADITYVLGGRYMQRYVSVIERADGAPGYFVLPVQWNIPQSDDQSGTWTPFHADDWQDPSRDWRVACAGCHTTGLDGTSAVDQTAFGFVEGFQAGQVELNIGCEACHGPGSLHMGKPGTLVKAPDAQACGQCHAQGQDPGGEHAYPVGYQPGLALDEGVFELAAPDDESVWWPTGHARTYNQYGEWLASAHGQTRFMGDVCARCHGTAPAVEGWTLADVTNGITCTACHDPHASGLRLPVTALETPSEATPEPQPQPTPTPEPDEEEEELPPPDDEELPPPDEEEELPPPDEEESLPPDEEDEGAVIEEEEEPPAPTPAPTQSFSWGGTSTPAPTGGTGFSWDQDRRLVRWGTAADPQNTALQREVPLDYTLCVSCHNSRTLEDDALLIGGKLHNPVQEMFEGWQMVEEIPGVPSAHFSTEGGPLCVTCHMPKTVQIGEFGRVGSHSMRPVLPGAEIEPDSCSGCHGDQVTRPALQQFIDDAQAGTSARIAAIEQAAGSDAPAWVMTALDFVQGDGSQGIHNPAYTDALLGAAEIELGLRTSGPSAPQATPAQPVLEPQETESASTTEAEGGLTTPSIILLLLAGVIIAVAAYAFFVREVGHV